MNITVEKSLVKHSVVQTVQNNQYVHKYKAFDKLMKADVQDEIHEILHYITL